MAHLLNNIALYLENRIPHPSSGTLIFGRCGRLMNEVLFQSASTEKSSLAYDLHNYKYPGQENQQEAPYIG